MPRIADFDHDALADLLRRQHGVLTREQAHDCGMSEQAVRHRLREAGPWQRLLPGIYLSATGSPTAVQRETAALLYGGTASMITGPAALFNHGIQVAYTELVDILIPAATRRRDHAFVRTHRTARMPAQVYADGEIRYAPPARAVADTAREMTKIREVRAVVADAVQRRRCPLPLLVDEARAGPTRGSALLGQALAEVTEGVRSAVEAELRDLIKKARLPVPLFNPRLSTADGQFIAQPDCWWADAGVAAEVDSREWHLSPHDWERTLARHARMSAHGILVLHFTPGRIRGEPLAVTADIAAAIKSVRDRGRLPIRAAAAS